MRNIEINNEIVSMRQTVRQARICVINKLVREAKRLRSNQGNEKQLERNRSRADKLLREVFALKRVKDDEISKLGIVKFDDLQDLLQNVNTDDETRAMVKVARYRILQIRISDFMEKFPDYEEYISWRQKKHPIKRKRDNIDDATENKNVKRAQKDVNTRKSGKCMEHTHNTRSRVVSSDKEDISDTVKEENSNVDEKRKTTGKGGLLKKSKEKKSNEAPIEEEKKNVTNDSIIKVVSKEAAVKRFTEILQERSSEHVKSESEECSTSKLVETVKRTDDFFLNSDATTSCSNREMLSEEKNKCTEMNKKDNSFVELQGKNGKVKYHRDKMKKERRNGAKRKVEYDGNPSRKGSNEATGSSKNTNTRKESSRANTSSTQSKNLHPSWAAKKKQQEIIKQGFQGKRIQFDEN